MSQLRTPDDVKALLQRRFERQHQAWLLGDGEWPWRIPLGSPTESDVINNLSGVRAWAITWSDSKLPVALERIERSWPRMGRQDLPSFAVVESADQVAQILGAKTRWTTATQRATMI